MSLIIDNHVVHEGDTIVASVAGLWTGERWREYDEPERWQVDEITAKQVQLTRGSLILTVTLENLRLGKLRVVSVERPAAPDREEHPARVADLYAASRRLKERIYAAVDKEAQKALIARHKALLARLDELIDQIR